MGKSLNILCIDGDAAEREAIQEYVGILNWSITFALNCKDGYQHATAGKFDLIVTEHKLPDCDGIELVRELRAECGPNSATPVLLSTGSLCERVVSVARDASIDATVLKPMLFTTFKGEVQKLVGRCQIQL